MGRNVENNCYIYDSASFSTPMESGLTQVAVAIVLVVVLVVVVIVLVVIRVALL